MKNEDVIICFKSKTKVIYFSTPSENHHFVPERNWKGYLAMRHATPKVCRLFNTILEARIGAIDFYEGYLSVRHLMDKKEFIPHE